MISSIIATITASIFKPNLWREGFIKRIKRKLSRKGQKFWVKVVLVAPVTYILVYSLRNNIFTVNNSVLRRLIAKLGDPRLKVIIPLECVCGLVHCHFTHNDNFN